MGEGRGNIKTNQTSSHPQWLDKSIETAQTLLSHIPEISQKLFESDDLNNFFELLCRMPYQHFLNLLLIYEKFPSATCLASTKVWSRYLAPDTQYILKPEHVGKQITLLAPFTSGADAQLIWFSINVYDISQTHVKDFILHQDIYRYDSDHISYLLEAADYVLGHRYQTKVLPDPCFNRIFCLSHLGQETDYTITVSDRLSDEQKLFWLTENICRFHIKSNNLSVQTSAILVQTLCICLFKLWGISVVHLPSLPFGSYRIIPQTEQHPFLNILQHSLYEIDQMISSAYLFWRNSNTSLSFDYDLY